MNTLDSRISNIDQLLTQDVEKFCSSVADLYTNISKVRDLPRRFITESCFDLAVFGYHYLRSEAIRIDRYRWSFIAGVLFALLGTSFDEVRRSSSVWLESRVTLMIDFVVRLDAWPWLNNSSKENSVMSIPDWSPTAKRSPFTMAVDERRWSFEMHSNDW